MSPPSSVGRVPLGPAEDWAPLIPTQHGAPIPCVAAPGLSPSPEQLGLQDPLAAEGFVHRAPGEQDTMTPWVLTPSHESFSSSEDLHTAP